jgi:hypothetical protein
MPAILINYADGGFAEAQRLNAHTGLLIGGFDRVISYGRKDLDPEFYARNRAILDEPRGAGYWLWKPYVTLRTLRDAMGDGDVLFYCDSACFFLAPVAPLVALCLQRPDKPVLLFSGDPRFSNRRYTKRDCLHHMGVDREPFLSAPQALGTFFICQKSTFTLAFMQEWLRLAENPRILTDRPNESGLPDYPDFIAHRHDQSILSLLGVKHGVSVLPDISQWGNRFRPRDIPQIVAQTRSRA